MGYSDFSVGYLRDFYLRNIFNKTKGSASFVQAKTPQATHSPMWILASGPAGLPRREGLRKARGLLQVPQGASHPAQTPARDSPHLYPHPIWGLQGGGPGQTKERLPRALILLLKSHLCSHPFGVQFNTPSMAPRGLCQGDSAGHMHPNRYLPLSSHTAGRFLQN